MSNVWLVKFVAAAFALATLTSGATLLQGSTLKAHAPIAVQATAPAKQTITGIAKALPAYNPNKTDPAIASATVTVTVDGKDVVYLVYGWGGIICARNDGKTVQVTGKVGTTTDGQLTILAASVNVKVIVVQ